jgi:hypothetical protein
MSSTSWGVRIVTNIIRIYWIKLPHFLVLGVVCNLKAGLRPSSRLGWRFRLLKRRRPLRVVCGANHRAGQLGETGPPRPYFTKNTFVCAFSKRIK